MRVERLRGGGVILRDLPPIPRGLVVRGLRQRVTVRAVDSEPVRAVDPPLWTFPDGDVRWWVTEKGR